MNPQRLTTRSSRPLQAGFARFRCPRRCARGRGLKPDIALDNVELTETEIVDLFETALTVSHTGEWLRGRRLQEGT
jgi:hypothetical protein